MVEESREEEIEEEEEEEDELQVGGMETRYEKRVKGRVRMK